MNISADVKLLIFSDYTVISECDALGALILSEVYLSLVKDELVANVCCMF